MTTKIISTETIQDTKPQVIIKVKTLSHKIITDAHKISITHKIPPKPKQQHVGAVNIIQITVIIIHGTTNNIYLQISNIIRAIIIMVDKQNNAKQIIMAGKRQESIANIPIINSIKPHTKQIINFITPFFIF